MRIGTCMNDGLHWASQWEQWMPLSEHLYCVAVTFKMTEQVEQRIWIKFHLKLDYSSEDIIQMIQKSTAIGNWYQQLHHSTPTHASRLMQFFCETSNHAGDSALLQPIFVTCNFWLFPKLKSCFKREEISDHWWDSGKYGGAADGNWENCVRSQNAYFEGNWSIIVLCTVFLVSCIFFNKYLYFPYYKGGYLLHRPRMLYSDKKGDDLIAKFYVKHSTM